MILKVRKVKEESNNSFSIIFDKPIQSFFYPGQYLEIEDKCFSLSSSPTEEFFMITVKKGISNLKKRFEKLKPGDKLEFSHPAGTVTIDEVDPIVLVAGGIGITPFRSMIKWAVEKRFKTPITLIYSNHDDDFIFKEELDSYKKSLPNLNLHLINTGKEGRITPERLKQIVDLNSESIFYVAGPHGFVNSLAQMILDLGVDYTNIRTDKFDGYD